MTNTHYIPRGHLGDFLDKIGKLAKRGERYDVPVTWTVGDPVEFRDDKKLKELGLDRRYYGVVLYPVQVSDTTVKVGDGWNLVAAMDFEYTKPTFRVVPGEEVPASFFEAEPGCDHCHRKILRRHTYLVRKDDHYMQVGSTCVKDYLGIDPQTLAAKASYISQLLELIGDLDDDGFGFGGGYPDFDIHQVLSTAAASIEVDGWASASGGSIITTRDCVSAALYARSDTDDARRFLKKADLKKADRVATATIDYVSSLTESTNTYVHNLRTVIGDGFVTDRTMGLAVSAVNFYLRERERQEALEGGCNEHFGAVGDRVEVDVKLVGLRYIEGYYGATEMHRFQDAAGREFVWFNSGRSQDSEIGRHYHLRGTIKAHDEYKGAKQTKLSRCRLEEQAVAA